jgi:hypothetical protein
VVSVGVVGSCCRSIGVSNSKPWKLAAKSKQIAILFCSSWRMLH